MLHNEQPQYNSDTPAEQFFREWDTWYNNEPMRCAFRDMDLNKWIQNSGFKKFNNPKHLSPGAKYTNGKIISNNNGFWFIFTARK